MSTRIRQCTVERAGSTAVEVSWQLDGPPIDVDVAHGPSPTKIAHDQARRVTAGTQHAYLDQVESGPVFVSVSAAGDGPGTICGTRRVLLDGPTNFRDLGGFASELGGHTKWGQVFRSDALHSLSSIDLAGLERLGLSVVYDLRSDRERSELPNPIDSIQYEMIGRPAQVESEDNEARIAEFLGDADGERILRDIYVGMLEHSPTLFGKMYTGMADQSRLPAVFHCHAGKDRTGMTAALLLLALGVSTEDVLEDYTSTAQFWDGSRSGSGVEGLVKRGMSAEAAAGLLGAPRWAMSDAIEALNENYGGIERFLLGPAAMQRDALHHLRLTLVD